MQSATDQINPQSHWVKSQSYSPCEREVELNIFPLFSCLVHFVLLAQADFTIQQHSSRNKTNNVQVYVYSFCICSHKIKEHHIILLQQTQVREDLFTAHIMAFSYTLVIHGANVAPNQRACILLSFQARNPTSWLNTSFQLGQETSKNYTHNSHSFHQS